MKTILPVLALALLVGCNRTPQINDQAKSNPDPSKQEQAKAKAPEQSKDKQDDAKPKDKTPEPKEKTPEQPKEKRATLADFNEIQVMQWELKQAKALLGEGSLSNQGGKLFSWQWSGGAGKTFWRITVNGDLKFSEDNSYDKALITGKSQVGLK